MTPLYVYYGDDFTGSTDVLESLAANGVETVLFLRPPSPAEAARFAQCQAVGFAGDSRSRSPEWMGAELPAIFARMAALGAPVAHYKVCSTFDSAPHRGSIGRAMEIGRDAFASAFVPVVVGAPHLRRYVVFGELFASAGPTGEVFRIDRHPTMSRHPATPMTEADLRLHLAAQTDLRLGLIDLPTLQSGQAEAALDATLAAGSQGVVFDGVDAASLAQAGRLLWARAKASSLFGVGSSGFSHALLAAWREAGLVAAEPPKVTPGSVDRLLVMSGSCSPVTADQIRAGVAAGYATVPLEPAGLLGDPAVFEACLAEACAALSQGRNVVVHSAVGPLAQGVEVEGEALGARMGELLRAVIERSSVRRVLLCGGDTSSHAVQQLGLYALTWAGPLQPGAPLCRAHGDGPLDGLELVLKGGQMGGPDFFERVRLGG